MNSEIEKLKKEVTELDKSLMRLMDESKDLLREYVFSEIDNSNVDDDTKVKALLMMKSVVEMAIRDAVIQTEKHKASQEIELRFNQ